MPKFSLSFRRKSKTSIEKFDSNDQIHSSSAPTLTTNTKAEQDASKSRKDSRRTSLRRLSLKKLKRAKGSRKTPSKNIEKNEISLPKSVDSIRSPSKESGYGSQSQNSPTLPLPHDPDTEDVFDVSLRLSNGDIPSENGLLAEAFWSHVTLLEDELKFKVGDVIRVLDMDNPDWWWGEWKSDQGWFPATHVRILVNQHQDTSRNSDYDNFNNEELHEYSRVTTFDDDVNGNKVTSFSIPDNGSFNIQKAEKPLSESDKKEINNQVPNIVVSPVSKNIRRKSILQNQMRKNVINEIINSEKAFLGHLKDVIEGYLSHCNKRKDMFSTDEISTLFGNINKIYEFQTQFFTDIKSSINRQSIHLSALGKVFLKNRAGFSVYLNYCNNHHKAVSLLSKFLAETRYYQFFEACRLLQRIELSLNLFLLTPVQKISKYSLQLTELLKHTPPDHADHTDIKAALSQMKKFTNFIVENKQKRDNIQKIVQWQETIQNWQGEDLICQSKEFIHCGEVYSYSPIKHRMKLRSAFLFDNQLILCKKDPIYKSSFHFKAKYNLNSYKLTPVKEKPRPRSGELKQPIKEDFSFGWKITNLSTEHSTFIYSKNDEEFDKWIKAFSTERMKASKHSHDEREEMKDINLLKSALIFPEKPKELPLTRSSSYRSKTKPQHHSPFSRLLHSELSPPDLSSIKLRSSSLRRSPLAQSKIRENHFIF